jgi:trk system potassium uptake protein TrkA
MEKILLIGGKNKAKSLAQSLLAKGYKVTAINASYEDCQILAKVEGLLVVNGDGTKPYVLEEACASDYDTAIALTDKDEDNLVACELCKKKFKVNKTVSLVADPSKTDFFYKMGIDSVVCAISAVTGILEQEAFKDKMADVIKLGDGRVRILEVPILQEAPVVGKKLCEISLPKAAIIGCVLRGDQTIIPRGDTCIMANDQLVVITDKEQEGMTLQELTGK